MLDRDGSLRQCCDRVLAERPEATFEELERACFPGRDGEFGLVALSPRHLEAVATRTCQILIEGEYGGVLEPDRHYIPLRRDFSNLDDVLETMRRDEYRARIVETAYQDIVASGTWSYPRFVERLEEVTVGGPPRAASPRAARVAAAWARVTEAVSWGVVALRAWLRRWRPGCCAGEHARLHVPGAPAASTTPGSRRRRRHWWTRATRSASSRPRSRACPHGRTAPA